MRPTCCVHRQPMLQRQFRGQQRACHLRQGSVNERLRGRDRPKPYTPSLFWGELAAAESGDVVRVVRQFKDISRW